MCHCLFRASSGLRCRTPPLREPQADAVPSLTDGEELRNRLSSLSRREMHLSIRLRTPQGFPSAAGTGLRLRILEQAVDEGSTVLLTGILFFSFRSTFCDPAVPAHAPVCHPFVVCTESQVLVYIVCKVCPGVGWMIRVF